LKCAAPWKSWPQISAAKARKLAVPERRRIETGLSLLEEW
jgi:hypothetical protein